MKRRVLAVVAVLAATITLFPPVPASAVTAGDWSAGHIIDDPIFRNSTSMSAQDIQNFLNSKVPNCDTNGTQASEYGGGTRAQYGTSRGYPPPYRCLKDYYENVDNKQNNLSSHTIPAGAKSAAQIIYDYAQQYRINPQALIVLLQKEQALVTDTWPFSLQYRSATGYGCPDTAACDSQYYGFSNQVRMASRMFQAIMDDDPNWYTPYVRGTNFIRWSPNASCGGTNVNVVNWGTAALYNYTPYQPNQAALNNMYGTGDACSAYGNRNFWRTFHDWFGSTRGRPHYALYISQSNYPVVAQGRTATASFTYKNSGNSPWYDTTSVPAGQHPITLAANEPMNRASAFGATWPSRSRAAVQFSKVYEANGYTLAANQHVAQPGQVVRFEFTVTVPETLAPGVYKESFLPIREGAPNAHMGGEAFMNVYVKPAYQATYHSESAFPTITQGETATGFIKYKNTGAADWKDSDTVSTGMINLATSKSINRPSIFGSNWGPGKNRPATHFKVYESNGTTLASDQNIVHPGQIAGFEFTFTVPANAPTGLYHEEFQPIPEGKPNFEMGGHAFLKVDVKQANYKGSYSGQSSYPTLAAGSTATGYFLFKNTGNARWYDSSSAAPHQRRIHLATNSPINYASPFGATWGPGKNRPSLTFNKVYLADGVTLAANQHVVEPGQIARFEFTISAPPSMTPGTYRAHFIPVVEGAAYGTFNGPGTYLDITIQ